MSCSAKSSAPDAPSPRRGATSGVKVGPLVPGAGAEAVLEEARRWMRHADSAFKRGDFQEMGRALQFLRELLEPVRKR
jgi:hypothetical protein